MDDTMSKQKLIGVFCKDLLGNTEYNESKIEYVKEEKSKSYDLEVKKEKVIENIQKDVELDLFKILSSIK
jgi:hypothetical protein